MSRRKSSPKEPFESLDIVGVGQLVRMGTKHRPGPLAPRLKSASVAEHGGDPQSIYFFNEVGLDYVSCSPFRVPVARLAAAQAALREKRKQG